MKVLILCHEYPPYLFGGVGSYAYNLSLSLAKRGITVTVVSGISPVIHKIFVERPMKNLTIIRVWFPDKPVRSIWYQLLNSNLILELARRHDIIHANTESVSLLLNNLKRTGKPTVVSVHNCAIEQARAFFSAPKIDLARYASVTDFAFHSTGGFLGYIMQKKDYELADYLIFVAKHVEDEYKKYYGSRKGDTKVVYIGVSPKNLINIEYQNDSKLLREMIHFQFAGRLYFIKGPHYAIKVFKIIQDEIPEAELHIYGKGPLKNKLKKLIQKYKLSSKVKILGFVNKNYYDALIRSYDTMLFPSLYEACPMAMLEALVNGIPVITFDLSWVKEFKKFFGCLIRASKPYSLYEFAIAALKGYSLTPLKIPKEFTIHYMTQEIIKVYHELLK